MSEKQVKRIVVKVGTRVLTSGDNCIDKDIISALAGQIIKVREQGVEVVLVSSGAVGAGLGLLGLEKKGISLSGMQACASVGQTYLIDTYNEYFTKKGYVAGQILLTQEDFSDRKRFLNIRYTLNTLLKHKVVPVINENDSVSTKEIKCGDNDRLSGLVADLADADMLVILTDVEGLCDEKGEVVETVEDVNGDIRALCRGKGCEESTGGMLTKLEAVKNATDAGIACVIAGGKRDNALTDILKGKSVGTKFSARERTQTARKRWIAVSLKPNGSIVVDSGAKKAVVERNKSLLPSGVTKVSGIFSDGDVVEIISETGEVFARGLSNYSSEEIDKIKGKKTVDIENELGYKDYDEIIHRDNLVVVSDKK